MEWSFIKSQGDDKTQLILDPCIQILKEKVCMHWKANDLQVYNSIENIQMGGGLILHLLHLKGLHEQS